MSRGVSGAGCSSFNYLYILNGDARDTFIDDFGLKPLTGIQDEDFHEVISERYERRSTLVTSNLDIPEWQNAFPNRILGAATIDRLRHGAYRVVLDGKSYRDSSPEPRTQKQPVKEQKSNPRKEVKSPD